MDDGQEFVDFYQVLQVDPDCDRKTLEAAYRSLAKRYHPDQSQTADVTRFSEITAAYRTLRNAHRRAEYDKLHSTQVPQEEAPSSYAADQVGDNAALSDADDHAKILMFLYKRRREDAQNPGVGGFYLQEMLNCSHEHFEFHKWYLKEKGFIVLTEQGTLAITIQGVDHVISMSRKTKAEKLLLAKSADPEE